MTLQEPTEKEVLKFLKQEWESYNLLYQDYPWREDYRKKADALEIQIIAREEKCKYLKT